MSKKIVETFLRDWTYNCKFEFFQGGEDELKEVASKRGIKLPAHDLSVFKCIYAFTDRMNKNGCTLPKEEVEKSLETIVGKAVDFDHLRKRVVGYWVDAKLDGDKIIAYGVFFKGNFDEDYSTIKNLLENDVLAISFEAWGNRVQDSEGEGYNLTDIEFAGGALLIKENPAFPGSQVMEMATKTKVLEFAKVMKNPDSFLHFGEKKPAEKTKEFARLYISDIESIYRMLSEIECPVCNMVGWMDVTNMDYEESEADMTCVNCATKLKAKMTPTAEMAKDGIKIKSVVTMANVAMFEDALSYIKGFKGTSDELENSFIVQFEEQQMIEESKRISSEKRKSLTDEEFALVYSLEEKKIRVLPIHDPIQIENALKKLNEQKAEQIFQKLGISKDNVKRKILKKANDINMDELLKKYQKASIEEVLQEIAKVELKRELTVEEVASLKAEIEASAEIKEEIILASVKKIAVADAEKAAAEADAKSKEEVSSLKAEIAKLNGELEGFRKEKADAEKAKVDVKIKERRDSLGEFAKDMKDEDVLDEAKYEVALLKKENAELKAGKVTTQKPVLTKGSTDKDKSKESATRAKIDSMAFRGNQ